MCHVYVCVNDFVFKLRGKLIPPLIPPEPMLICLFEDPALTTDPNPITVQNDKLFITWLLSSNEEEEEEEDLVSVLSGLLSLSFDSGFGVNVLSLLDSLSLDLVIVELSI